MIQINNGFEDKVTGNELKYLMKLGSFMSNETRLAFPSIPTLAKVTGCSIRGVHALNSSLEKKGIIEIKRVKKDGKNLPNQYRLITSDLRVFAQIGHQFVEVKEAPIGVAQSLQGGGAKFAPELILSKPLCANEKKKEVLAPNLNDIVRLFAEKLAKMPGTTTGNEWAEWEAKAFAEYWDSRKWKDKSKSIVPNLSRRVATWVRRGTEKAKYTKPAPGAKGYGEYRSGNQAPSEPANDIKLSDAWEGSYKRFTAALAQAMGQRSKMVSPLTRAQYLDWSTHKKRPLTGRLNKSNLHKTLIRWATENTCEMNSYVLQRELKTADAFLWFAYTDFLKQTGRWGEYNEPNKGQYQNAAQTQAA